MVDGVNNVNGLRQTFSNKGMRLADLKDNKLLFDFFKSKGYDENSTIYASDLAKFDTDGKAGISKKEAKAMGLEGSRKEIKEARKLLEQIQNNELEEGTHLVKVDENTTDYYNEDGIRLATLTKNPYVGGIETLTKYDAQGQEILIQTMEPDANGNMVLKMQGEREYDDKGNVKNATLTTYDDNGNEDITHLKYENGKIQERIDIDKNNIKTTTKYDWFGDTLNSTTETTGQSQIFRKYENGEVVRTVESFIGDPDSAKTTTLKDGVTTIKYEGKFVKDGLIKEEINGDIKTQFYQDGTTVKKKALTDEVLETIPPEPPVQEKPKPVPEQKPTRVLVDVPDTWKRVKKDDANWEMAKESKTVEELADKFIEASADKVKDVDVYKEELVKQLKKFNPSVIDKDGTIKHDKLDKLDMPSIEDLKGMDTPTPIQRQPKEEKPSEKYIPEWQKTPEFKQKTEANARAAAKAKAAEEARALEDAKKRVEVTAQDRLSPWITDEQILERKAKALLKKEAKAEARAAADAKKLKDAAEKQKTVENYQNAFGQNIPQQRRPGDPLV